MLMLVWFWATTAAALIPTPAQVMSLPTQLFESQRTVADAAARPLMALGWVDEEDATIF